MDQQLAYRYRLHPSAEQTQHLLRATGTCRWAWNAALAYQHAEVAAGRPRPGFAALCRWLTGQRAAHDWLRLTSVHAQQQALRNLADAWTAHGTVAGRAAPTFKARRRTTPALRLVDAKDVTVVPGGVKLATLGVLPWTMHRPLRGQVNSVTVSREADGSWWASVQARHWVDPGPAAPAGSVTGVDRGVATALVTSTGEAHTIRGMPPAARRHEVRLQRAVARKARGSRRHAEATHRLARHQRRAARRRLQQVHVAVNAVLATAETVVLEALDVGAMTASATGTAEAPGTRARQKAGLNRAILDRAWGETARVLAYKARWRHRRVVTVRAAYSSQTCAACQHVDPASRETQARFRCTRCGHVDHADRNAGRVLTQRYARGEVVAFLASRPEDAVRVAALAGAPPPARRRPRTRGPARAAA